jgi:hypothetical protein
MGFKLTNASGGDLLDIDRIFSISAMFWEITIPDLGDNSTSIKAVPTNIPIIKCDQYEEGSLFSENFVAFSKKFNDIKCLDFKTLNRSISGALGNLGK